MDPLGLSWGALRVVLDRSWTLLGSLGVVLGGSWGTLGGSWGTLGRSKIDQKTDPKIDPKSSRIATEINRSGATPVDVSEVEESRREPDPVTP